MVAFGFGQPQADCTRMMGHIFMSRDYISTAL